jgi:hypothetical protein
MTYQGAEVEPILDVAVHDLLGTLSFSSVHAAVMQPHRLARWMEGGVNVLSEEQNDRLLQLVHQLLQPQRPAPIDDDQIPVGEAPGKVSVRQWKEGAVQLQREVSHGW